MFRKILSLGVIVCFFLTSLSPYTVAHADTVLDLPAPGTMINLSPAYNPVIIKGLTVHKDNPFLFDFIVDVGQDRMSGQPLKKEGEKLIKYFLASLAIPDKDLWVNLSPYEKNRMIPEVLGQTDMGRDLLEQDYILKQITASLIYPEKQLGKTFWDKVYAKSQQMYGSTQIPVNTFNKVWIMADKAEVFEHNQTAFVVACHLKVMLEEDYLALQKHSVAPSSQTHSIASKVVRTIILPELEKEINTGKNFANLRQIFNSVILSSWYKRNLKQALLNQVYANKSKVKGIDLNDPTVKQQIYEQYLKAYKKGVFNYIKEDVNNAGETIPRKYFSGGTIASVSDHLEVTTDPVRGVPEVDQSMTGDGMVDFAVDAVTKEPTNPSAAGEGTDNAMIETNREYQGLRLNIRQEALPEGGGNRIVTVSVSAKESPVNESPIFSTRLGRPRGESITAIGDAVLQSVQGIEPNDNESLRYRINTLDNALLSFRQDDKVGNVLTAFPTVFNPEALGVLEQFAPRTEEIHALLTKEAQEYKAQAQRGEEPGFLPLTVDGKDYVVPGMKVSVKQSNAGDFEGAPVPEIFQKPGATLTGPIARYGQPLEKSLRSIAYQLLSGADYVLLDGEDSFSQLGTMSLEGQRNLMLAIHKDPVFMKVAESVAQEMISKGKRPANWDWRQVIDSNYTTRVYRVRGLHLDDRQVEYTTADGRKIAISATLADMILYVVNNYKALLDQGAPIALYIPKLQSAEEAALIASILDELEATLVYKGQKLNEIKQEDGKTGGIIKTLVLIENVRAALQLMPIRAAFGRHLVLINTARWDYMATVIKAKDYDPNWVPGDFSRIVMTTLFMHTFENAVWRAANTPDKNGNTILWEGGMEVQIPTIPDNIPQVQKDGFIKAFMAKAGANKLREALAGAPRAWVAHPDMVDIVASVFKKLYGKGKALVLGQKKNLNGEDWTPLTYTPEDAKAFFKLEDNQTVTVAGVREDISVYMQYKINVLTGQGAASIKPADFFFDPSVPYLMEDRATDEGRGAGARKKFRARVQFTADDLSAGVKAGDRLTPELFDRLVEEEYRKLYQAPDRLVHDNIKETILPIARLALEKFVKSDVDIPWSVDLEGAVLGVTDPAKAGQLMDEYIDQLRASGGISRMTQNPQFVDAADDTAMLSTRQKKEVDQWAAFLQEIKDRGIEVPYAKALDFWRLSNTMVLLNGEKLNPKPEEQNYFAQKLWDGLVKTRGNLDRIKAKYGIAPDQMIPKERLDEIIDKEGLENLNNLFTITGGVTTGLQAITASEAGLLAVYFSGWQASNEYGQADLAKYYFTLVTDMIEKIQQRMFKKNQDQQARYHTMFLELGQLYEQTALQVQGVVKQKDKLRDLKAEFVQQAMAIANNKSVPKPYGLIYYQNSDYVNAFSKMFGRLFDRVVVITSSKTATLDQRERKLSDALDTYADKTMRKYMIDYLIPFFADGDTSHGKATEQIYYFVKSMAAAIHLEDQTDEDKKCGHMAGKVKVPTEKHVQRLREGRMAALLLRSKMLFVARTDTEETKLLSNLTDVKDEAFVKGTLDTRIPKLKFMIRLAFREIVESRETPEQILAGIVKDYPEFDASVKDIWKILDAMKKDGKDTRYDSNTDNIALKTAMEKLTGQWAERAKPTTFIDAVKAKLIEEGEQRFADGWVAAADPLKRVRTIDQLKDLAHSRYGVNLNWDYEKPRTYEGFYQIKPGVKLAVVVAREYKKYAEVVWMEQKGPHLDEAYEFAAGVNKPGDAKRVFMALNLSPSFNWSNPTNWKKYLTPVEIGLIQAAYAKDNFDWKDQNTWGNQATIDALNKMLEEIRRFNVKMGLLGFGFQFITIFSDNVTTLAMLQAGRDLLEKGMAGFVQGTQQVSQRRDVQNLLALGNQNAAGAVLNAAVDGLSRGGTESFVSATGKDATQHQFGVHGKGDKALLNGGIDLNTSNGMQWKDTKDGKGVEMNVDSAAVARIERDGINWLSPEILRMTPVRSVWPLVGLQAPVHQAGVVGV